MGEVNACFFFKFHPDDKSTFRGKGQHVHELQQEADIYSLMGATDTLISDYSSIIFDYMLMERPIIYYMPDLAAFTSSSRSLIFDPEEIAVGPVCHNGRELLDALRNVAEGTSIDSATQSRWTATRARFNQYTASGSSDRVLKAIDERYFEGGLVGTVPD